MSVQTYTFFNGAQIHLEKIVCIGTVEKNGQGIIFIPVFCTGISKPVTITIGACIGPIPDEQKRRMMEVLTDFSEQWNIYLDQKNENVPRQ